MFFNEFKDPTYDQQIHYANSIVTGYLSSVVKVHEAQTDLLAELGVERELGKEIGEKLADVSTKITSLVDNAKKTDEKLEGAEATANSLKSAIARLKGASKIKGE